jgi:hypothetical protein
VKPTTARSAGLAIALLAGATVAAAQPPRPARFAWDSVAPSTRIRVATDSGFLVARFAGIRGDTLLLGSCQRRCPPPSSSALRLPLASLGPVFVQRGHRAAEGLRAGLAIGAVTGAVAGAAIGRTGELSAAQTTVAGLLSGAVLGAAVGPAIGSGSPRWRPLARLEPGGGLGLGLAATW